MLKLIFIEAIKRSWFASTLFALTELLGGLYLAFLISAIVSTKAIQNYDITKELIIFGIVLSAIRSIFSYISINTILKIAFDFSKEVIIKNFNAVLEVLEREKGNQTMKGDLIKSSFLTSSMGVSYKLKLPKNI